MAYSMGPGKIVEDGLVFYVDAANKESYPGSGTTWFDLKGNDNGTLTSSPTFVNENGGVIDFDSTDYVNTNLDSSTYNSFSINAWVNGDSLSTYQTVAAQTRYGTPWSNSSWLLYIEAPGGTPYMTFYIGSGGSFILAGKNTVLSSGQWYHVVGTWDGSTSKLYINGVKETTEGTVPSMNTTPINTLIGASLNGGGTGNTGYWNGKISNVQIHNRALSSQEVNQNYNALKGRFV